MSKKSRKPTAGRQKQTLPRQVLHLGLQEAEQLLDHGHSREARFILEDLHQHFPRDPDVLARLVNACYDMHDMRHDQHYAEQRLALQPDDPDLLLSLADPWDAFGR
jgi:uncharacterized protein HemY